MRYENVSILFGMAVDRRRCGPIFWIIHCICAGGIYLLHLEDRPVWICVPWNAYCVLRIVAYMIDQVVIACTGLSAIWCTQHKNPKVQRFACILGLIGQPFWFWTTYQAEQWGLFFLCFVYLGIWLMGLKNNWLNRPKEWTMNEPEDLINLQHPNLDKEITQALIEEIKNEL